LAQSPKTKTASAGELAQVVGTWRGNSVCIVDNSPCHDEINVYRFAEIAGKPGTVSVTASKVVDGKEIVMGSGEWKYDAEEKTLEWEGPHGTFRFAVQSDKMESSLTQKRGVVYRRIYLKEEK
jgi:hypothetical protein